MEAKPKMGGLGAAPPQGLNARYRTLLSRVAALGIKRGRISVQ